MNKYPHGLTVLEICRAIDAYEAKQDDLPEQGMIDAFQILLSAIKPAPEPEATRMVEVSAIMEARGTSLPMAITPDGERLFIWKYGQWVQFFPATGMTALKVWSAPLRADRKVRRGIFTIKVG